MEGLLSTGPTPSSSLATGKYGKYSPSPRGNIFPNDKTANNQTKTFKNCDTITLVTSKIEVLSQAPGTRNSMREVYGIVGMQCIRGSRQI